MQVLIKHQNPKSLYFKKDNAQLSWVLILTLQYNFILHYDKILKFILVYFLVWLLKEWTLLQNSVLQCYSNSLANLNSGSHRRGKWFYFKSNVKQKRFLIFAFTFLLLHSLQHQDVSVWVVFLVLGIQVVPPEFLATEGQDMLSAVSLWSPGLFLGWQPHAGFGSGFSLPFRSW